MACHLAFLLLVFISVMFFRLQKEKSHDCRYAIDIERVTGDLYKNREQCQQVANQNTERFKKERVVLSEQAPQGVRATVAQVNSPGVVLVEQTGQGWR